MIDAQAQARAMVETQIRPNEVTHVGLLAAMRGLPRARFVPAKFARLAYMDEQIPVFPAVDGAPARFLLAPMVQARLIQLAEIEPQDTVLDLGCATGYSTAVLAQLAARVIGLEPEPELAEAARANLAGLGLHNAEIVSGPLAEGWAAEAPYDAIVVEGSVSEVPQSLWAQLKDGGRLAAVVTCAPNMQQGKAYLFTRVNGEASGVAQFDAGASPLPGLAPAPAFAF